MIVHVVSLQIRKPIVGWICASCRGVATTSVNNGSNKLTSKGASCSRKWNPVSTRQYASATANIDKAAPRSQDKLPSAPARTRFAPSPTGYLHIGGLRTALFSYLLAKRTGGQFLLRIEDTDQKRLVTDAEQRLFEDLQWAGLQWDEGPQVNGPFGPYRQSERTHIYQKHAQELVASGAAYRCFCTPQTTGSDGTKAAYVTSGCYQDCSSLSSEESQERAESKEKQFTIRLKQPNDAHQREYKDLIFGKIRRLHRSAGSGLGDEDENGLDAADTILVKSDGTPTYHFANVVDDHLMQITHVIRGSEWLASTPLHYDLYTAFAWEPPKFVHVGLLVDENHAKLSKRSINGLVLDVRGMREQEAVLPETLCNFLALLGWHNPNQDDLLGMKELERDFDLRFTKKNTVVRMEKLWFLQKRHVAQKCEQALKTQSREPVADIAKLIAQEVRLTYPETSNSESLEDYCADILLVDSKSYRTPKEYVERNNYFFAFNPLEIPEQKEFYDQNSNISGNSLSTFTHLLLADFDWSQPYRTTKFPNTKSGSSQSKKELSSTSVSQTSARISAAMSNTVWQILLNPDVLRDVGTRNAVPSEENLKALPFTTDPVDIRACAQYVSEQQQHNPTAEEIVEQYKSWNKALMRFLREKLSYGLHGPGVGDIMALLGYKECCRRLGVEPRKDGGW